MTKEEIKEEPKKKKGKGLIMAIIFIIMLALVGVIFFLLKGTDGIKKIIPSAPKEFDNYYEVLKKYENPKFFDKTDLLYIHAYKLEGVENIVVSEEHTLEDGTNITALYYMKDGKVVEKEYNYQSEIKPLFYTDKEEYGYWLIENVDGKIIYTLLDDVVKESESPLQLSVNEKDNYTTSSNDVTTKIAPTEEHFIEFSNSASTTRLEKNEMKKFKRELKQVISDADLAEDTILADDDSTVKAKLEEIRKMQKEVANYKETIKVGSHTLKLGTYSGKMQNMDGSTSKVKVILKKNKIVVDGQETSYYVKGKFLMVHDFEMFQIDKDDQMVYLAGECPTLKYQG